MAATFATAVYVEAPPAVVFAAVTDLGTLREWMPGLISIEKLTPGVVGAGTEFRETRHILGREASEHVRVTRFEPPSRIDLHIDGSKGTSGRGEFLFSYDFVPERTGTNVELSGEIRMPGIWAVFAQFAVGKMKDVCHADLEALKAHIESPWTPGRGR